MKMCLAARSSTSSRSSRSRCPSFSTPACRCFLAQALQRLAPRPRRHLGLHFRLPTGRTAPTTRCFKSLLPRSEIVASSLASPRARKSGRSGRAKLAPNSISATPNPQTQTHSRQGRAELTSSAWRKRSCVSALPSKQSVWRMLRRQKQKAILSFQTKNTPMLSALMLRQYVCGQQMQFTTRTVLLHTRTCTCTMRQWQTAEKRLISNPTFPRLIQDWALRTFRLDGTRRRWRRATERHWN
mmetsp:Transcript_98495/g.158821  ORF Transcript_98495/g.158821 Transcript_98495/m.158821 type:complete len:241 (-) Transcript_98495:453-1175(-)